MHNDTWATENVENRKSQLLKIYNIIDWMDFGLIFLIIAYYSTISSEAITALDLNQAGAFFDTMFSFTPSVIGLMLCLASLVVCVSAIIVSILIQKSGANKSKLRLAVRFIIWGVWIPFDLYLIFMSLTGLIGR